MRAGSGLAMVFAVSVRLQPAEKRWVIRVMQMVGGLKALDALGSVVALRLGNITVA